MRSASRWLVAILVTGAAFVVTTWICGALLLPVILKDPTIRWSLAVGLGLALAALAALWGNSFATGERPAESLPGVAAGPARTASGRTRNIIRGGTFQGGPVIQGRDISGPISGGPRPAARPPGPSSPAPDGRGDTSQDERT